MPIASNILMDFSAMLITRTLPFKPLSSALQTNELYMQISVVCKAEKATLQTTELHS